jgi:hypothetical protein
MPEADPQPTPDTDLTALRQQLEQANQRLVHAELKAHALRAGIIDVEGLKLLDTSKLKLNDDGTIPDAETTLATFKRDKPWLFSRSSPTQSTSHPAPAPKAEEPKTRMAKDMSYNEWQAARERLIRGR